MSPYPQQLIFQPLYNITSINQQKQIINNGISRTLVSCFDILMKRILFPQRNKYKIVSVFKSPCIFRNINVFLQKGRGLNYHTQTVCRVCFVTTDIAYPTVLGDNTAAMYRNCSSALWYCRKGGVQGGVATNCSPIVVPPKCSS